MAFTPLACRTALATALSLVPGVGVVHKYRRIVRDMNSAQVHLTNPTTGRINGWMISPAGANPVVNVRQPGFNAIGAKGGGQVMTTFQFQVEAYYDLDDQNASEEAFQDLIWAVALDLNSYGALNISGIVAQLPANVEQFGFVMFAGSFLLHYARLDIGFTGKTV